MNEKIGDNGVKLTNSYDDKNINIDYSLSSKYSTEKKEYPHMYPNRRYYKDTVQQPHI